MIKILITIGVAILIIAFLVNLAEDDENVTITPVVMNERMEPQNNSDTKNNNQNGINEPDLNDTVVLDLHNQELTQTPDYVFDKTDIQKLDVSNNNLTGSLQAEVRQLTELKVLDLSNNRFTGVPAEIGQLNKLEFLNLSYNQITGLPLELGNLSNLKVLNLQGNNYTESDLEIIRTNLPTTTQVITD